MKLKTILLLIFALFYVSSINAQKNSNRKIKISGYVKDMNDSPLKNVSIIIDNIPSSVFTNKKGYYKIKVYPDIKSITAYSMIHGGLKIKFSGKTKINFILASDTTNPNFISLAQGKKYNTGYGTMDKDAVSTTINSIEHADNQLNTYSNIYDMIEAQVTGVVIRNKSITIRGISSILNQGEPLFVVDGSIVYSIDDINPNHVQSINVLKGAAASIYGVRGTFGVLVINLKKGKEI
jgi:TonB-dependent SusC/RagA subfamily outer membrane receptor